MRALLESAGIFLKNEQLEQLETYREMLLDWNTRMDLTSVREGDVAVRHFLDSLLPLGTGELVPASGKLIDVGTGAGFPGLPLAVALPALQVMLLDAQEKRCAFLRAVTERLALKNVRVIHGRAEEAARDPALREGFDAATARAVAGMRVLCEYLLPFVKVGGSALCWKGPAAVQELTEAENAIRLLGGGETKIWPMNCGEEQHVVVQVKKNCATAEKYPRKNGIPAKRPL